jgi:hypothetical protein
MSMRKIPEKEKCEILKKLLDRWREMRGKSADESSEKSSNELLDKIGEQLAESFTFNSIFYLSTRIKDFLGESPFSPSEFDHDAERFFSFSFFENPEIKSCLSSEVMFPLFEKAGIDTIKEAEGFKILQDAVREILRILCGAQPIVEAGERAKEIVKMMLDDCEIEDYLPEIFNSFAKNGELSDEDFGNAIKKSLKRFSSEGSLNKFLTQDNLEKACKTIKKYGKLNYKMFKLYFIFCLNKKFFSIFRRKMRFVLGNEIFYSIPIPEEEEEKKKKKNEPLNIDRFEELIKRISKL